MLKVVAVFTLERGVVVVIVPNNAVDGGVVAKGFAASEVLPKRKLPVLNAGAQIGLFPVNGSFVEVKA